MGALLLRLSIMDSLCTDWKDADGHYTEDSPFKDKITVFFVLVYCFIFERALLSCFGIYLFFKREAVREINETRV